MDLTFGTVYDKGLAEGWDALSPQEHAVLLYRGIGEKALENDRRIRGAGPAIHDLDTTKIQKRAP